MATWQCDFFLIPRASVSEVIMEHQGVRVDAWSPDGRWAGYHLPPDYEERLSASLVRGASWDADLQTWGEEQGNRVDVWAENGRVEEVMVRVDARRPERSFVEQVADFASYCELIAVSPERRLFEPTPDNLLLEVRRSAATLFVDDPQGFLNALSYVGGAPALKQG
jgi:hypothetical protein